MAIISRPEYTYTTAVVAQTWFDASVYLARLQLAASTLYGHQFELSHNLKH